MDGIEILLPNAPPPAAATDMLVTSRTSRLMPLQSIFRISAKKPVENVIEPLVCEWVTSAICFCPSDSSYDSSYENSTKYTYDLDASCHGHPSAEFNLRIAIHSLP